MVDVAGIVVGSIFGVFLSIFGLFAFRFLKWFRHRNDVYVDLDLRQGKTIRYEMKPVKDGTLRIKDTGRYLAWGGAFTLFKGKPLFRFREGDPRPIRFFKDPAAQAPKALANGGTPEVREWFQMPIELAGAEHAIVPAESLEVFLKQHLFADAYASRLGLLVLLGLGILVILFAVVGLYAR